MGIITLATDTRRKNFYKVMFRSNGDCKMDSGNRLWLIDYYRDDVTRLAAMLNRDLSAWLSCAV